MNSDTAIIIAMTLHISNSSVGDVKLSKQHRIPALRSYARSDDRIGSDRTECDGNVTLNARKVARTNTGVSSCPACHGVRTHGDRTQAQRSSFVQSSSLKRYESIYINPYLSRSFHPSGHSPTASNGDLNNHVSCNNIEIDHVSLPPRE